MGFPDSKKETEFTTQDWSKLLLNRVPVISKRQMGNFAVKGDGFSKTWRPLQNFKYLLKVGLATQPSPMVETKHQIPSRCLQSSPASPNTPCSFMFHTASVLLFFFPWLHCQESCSHLEGCHSWSLISVWKKSSRFSWVSKQVLP